MSTATNERRSPYKGLIPYNEADAPFFFGRDKETRLIIANLFASPLTLLYGASGVGKSSVLRAGALHQLQQREDLLVVPFSAWQGDPVNDLVRSIADYAERTDAAGWRRVAARMEEARAAAVPLSLSALLAACHEQTGRRLMLILDQFEEYFLYHPQDDAFADEFPKAVLQTDVPVSFLISIREDALAKLDRFEGRIPSLFDNYLRIEHLGYDAAHDSIIRPVEKFNELHEGDAPPVQVEPALVAAVLEQVQTGQVVFGEAGRGRLKTDASEAQIETPFLQMVLTRLWDEEQRTGSHVLRLETLDKLGGAQRIVRTHLDATMSALAPAQQEIAADVFHYLVTPSGTKIAHTVTDLAEYAGLPRKELSPALEELTGSDTRILRGVAPSPDRPGESRYEIFHDVLAAAILDWRSRHVQARERAEAERLAEEQRREVEQQARMAEKAKSAGRLRWLSVALALMTLLALVTAAYAFKQRSRAEADASRAQAQAKEANVAKTFAEEQRGLAVTQSRRADEQAELAKTQAKEAEVARFEAEFERERADEQAKLARARAGEAEKARGEAVAARGVAETERQRANQQAAIAKSRELAAAAKSVLTSDPELGVLLALRGVAEATGENLTESERPGLKEIDRKEAVEALHESLQSSRVRHTLADPGSRVVEVAYGLNGKRLITLNNDGTVKLRDANSGQLLRDFSDHEYRGMTLSHDEMRLSLSGVDGAVAVWDLARVEIVRTLASSYSDPTIKGMAFSKDNSTLVVAGQNNFRLWNIAAGESFELPYEQSQQFEGAWKFSIIRDGIEILTFTDDGKTLVAGGCVHSDRAGCTTLGVKAWDVATRQESRKPVALEFGNFMQLRRTFSPDGKRLFTVTKKGEAKVWDTTSGKELFDLSSYNAIFPAAFSSDGQMLASLTKSGEIMLWDVATGKNLRTMAEKVGEDADLLSFSPDGKRIAVLGGRVVKLFDVASGRELSALIGHKSDVKRAAFSPDGESLVTTDDDGTAKLWDISPTKELLSVYNGNEGYLGQLLVGALFSPDGAQLAVASLKSVKLCDAASGKELRLLKPDSSINSLSYSPDGRRLATAHDGAKVIIWDTASGQSILVISKASDVNEGVFDIAFSPDGKLLAAASMDKMARLWDATTGKILHVLSGHTDGLFSVAFSPDGQYLATGSGDNTAKVWNVKTGQELLTLSGHENTVMKVRFSPDGKLLATASEDGYVKIWMVPSGKQLTTAASEQGGVFNVAFSPDGRVIATTSGDGKARVWDVSTGWELLNLSNNAYGSVAFSPDGRRLVTAGDDGYARVYTLDVQELVKLARGRVSRQALTPDERRKYLHEISSPQERPEAAPK